MNKYMTLILMVLFLVIVTIVADSALGISIDLIDQVNTPPPDTWGGRLSGALNIIRSFFLIMTFQVPQLPSFINLIVFYPLTFGIAYMIIDIIRG